MGTIKIYGLTEFSNMMRKMPEVMGEAAGHGIYEGARVMADSLKEGIRGIQTGGPSQWETKRREKQKQGLMESFGISKMQNDNGFLNVKMGFEGYNDVDTPKYPNGQPNVMVARMYNSGTSAMRKQAFFDRAERKARAAAKSAMIETIDQDIKKNTKG